MSTVVKDKYLSAIRKIFSDTYPLLKFNILIAGQIESKFNMFNELILTVNKSVVIKPGGYIPYNLSCTIYSDKYLSILNITKQGLHEYIQDTSGKISK